MTLTSAELIDQVRQATGVDYPTALDALLTIIDLPHTPENREFITNQLGPGTFHTHELARAIIAARATPITAPHNPTAINMDAVLIGCGAHRDPDHPNRPKLDLVGTCRRIETLRSGTVAEAQHPTVDILLNLVSQMAYGGAIRSDDARGPIVVDDDHTSTTMTIMIHPTDGQPFHARATVTIRRWADGTHDYLTHPGTIFTTTTDGQPMILHGHVVGALIDNMFVARGLFRQFADRILDDADDPPWAPTASAGLVNIINRDPSTLRRIHALSVLACVAPWRVVRCAEDLLPLIGVSDRTFLARHPTDWDKRVIELSTDPTSDVSLEHAAATIESLAEKPVPRADDVLQLTEMVRAQLDEARYTKAKLARAGINRVDQETHDRIIKIVGLGTQIETAYTNATAPNIGQQPTVVVSRRQREIHESVKALLDAYRWDQLDIETAYTNAGIPWDDTVGIFGVVVGITQQP
jgi:hypothetical protein